MSRNTLESSMIETAVTVDDASLPAPPCFADDMVAADVARGVGQSELRRRAAVRDHPGRAVAA